jgi:proteic killer suppression protein
LDLSSSGATPMGCTRYSEKQVQKLTWFISIKYLSLALVTYEDSMLISFGDKDTKKIWEGERVRGLPTEIQEIGRRKLRMLNNSQDLNDLQIPPSNRLEKLKGNLKDFYSIRINDQWRIIFKWNNGNAEQVEIIDYH